MSAALWLHFQIPDGEERPVPTRNAPTAGMPLVLATLLTVQDPTARTVAARGGHSLRRVQRHLAEAVREELVFVRSVRGKMHQPVYGLTMAGLRVARGEVPVVAAYRVTK